ncbi:hypothetical protein [Agromyces seonyuensis]|uniref:Uncharacterized protein n=1 Tax=Agromyces seonyuensis TaxID=2662446 RepID=A0A6I4P0S5_9MICO|nr:hypothetical protein [Agromyces seonyuensis]MWC00199.1 hypothetical protein [Agromyces seonyuensis]
MTTVLAAPLSRDFTVRPAAGHVGGTLGFDLVDADRVLATLEELGARAPENLDIRVEVVDGQDDAVPEAVTAEPRRGRFMRLVVRFRGTANDALPWWSWLRSSAPVQWDTFSPAPWARGA